MDFDLPFLKRINSLGDSPLIIAGRQGDISTLREIHQKLIDEYNFTSDDIRRIFTNHSNRLGKTVLHESAQNSNEECIEYLLDSKNSMGMNPDCLKQGDWTPLMLACTKNSLNVIRILVETGANLNLKNKDGWTPFHIACREGHKEIIAYFLNLKLLDLWKTQSKNGRTPLHTAALYGRESIVDLLLSENAYCNVDDTDSCGSTPLMDALRGGHIQVAKRLIEAKANPYQLDAVGRQPIHLAAQAGHEESVIFLIDLHVRLERQKSIDAKESFDEKIVWAQMANMLTSDAFQTTPVHFTAKEGHVNILKLFHSFGGALDSKDTKGRTPLHMASSCQHSECVEYLLSMHMQDRPDYDGVCPSQLARKVEVKRLFEVHKV